MKQAADNFTIDAFAKPRRGRPSVPNAKTGAQRQRELRARRKKGVRLSYESADLSVAQVRELLTIKSRFLAMGADWGDVDEYFHTRLESFADSVGDLILSLGEISVMGNEN